jgi:predicted SnoaL-like aldol condensation-catalyzing enzyme
MKKIFFAAFTAVVCICSSCTDTSSTSATTDKKENSSVQKNLAANDVITKAFETGDVKGIDSVVSDDFLDHTDHGDVKGRDSLKAMVSMVHGMMKDMKIEKVHDLADEDYVYSWMRYKGTSDGSMGMPKGPYDMGAIEVSKYRDGKAVEHWSFMDMQSMMKMMPPPGGDHMDKMDHKMDTSKMKK